MATTNTDFSTQIAAIQSKAASLAASTSDAKDLVFLGKAIEALTVPNSVASIIGEGDTQVANVTAQGVTSTNTVNAAGVTKVNAINSAAASFSLHPQPKTKSGAYTMLNNDFVMVTAASQTMTLPAGAANHVIYVSVGAFTNTVVAPNGSDKIMGLAESMTIDTANTTITFMYHSSLYGWRAF